MLSGFQWSPAATPLVAGLAGELRRRYVALIQRAYATLSAAKLASYLGVDQAEALQSALLLQHSCPLRRTPPTMSMHAHDQCAQGRSTRAVLCAAEAQMYRVLLPRCLGRANERLVGFACAD